MEKKKIMMAQAQGSWRMGGRTAFGPFAGDLLLGQVALKCVRINFIYWPQNPNRRPASSLGLRSPVSLSVSVSVRVLLLGWLLAVAY